MKKGIRFGIASHEGNKRQYNEDYVAFDTEKHVWVLSDGMGGHEAGDYAAQITAETTVSMFNKGHTLPSAILHAHQKVLACARTETGKAGMGATVVALHLTKSRAHFAWVGDSRIYLWDGNMMQLTSDHSYVQSLIDAGKITRAEGRIHPRRNVITRCIGQESDFALSVDEGSIPLVVGGKILLCSDGLVEELDDKQIREILSSSKSPQSLADQLVSRCLEGSASDNITVIVIET